MYCLTCGKELRGNGNFCAHCGTAIKASEMAPEESKEANELGECDSLSDQQAETEGGVALSPDPCSDAIPPYDVELDATEYIEEPPFDKKEAKRHFSKIGVAYMLYAAVSFLAAQILLVALNYVSPGIYGEVPELRVILSIVAIYGPAFWILMILARYIKREPIAEKNKVGVGVWLLYFVVGLGVMGLGSQISNVVDAILEIILRGVPSGEVDNIYAEGNVFLTAVYAVIIAPVGEEFVFRKIIIDRTRSFGGPICIILSAIMFGLMHGNIIQAIPAFGAGLVLGYLYYRYGRLLPCILIHAGINLYSTASTLVATKVINNVFPTFSLEAVMENLVFIIALLLFAMISIGCMTAAIVLPIVQRKKITFEAPSTPIPHGQKFRTVALNVGVILMFIVYIAEIFISYL